MIILSDRGVTRDFAPIPSLLAVAACIAITRACAPAFRSCSRPATPAGSSLRPAHRLRLRAINPYMAFETIDDMIREGLLTGIDHKKACAIS